MYLMAGQNNEIPLCRYHLLKVCHFMEFGEGGVRVIKVVNNPRKLTFAPAIFFACKFIGMNSLNV